ncbi:MAG TPA: glutamyl-tRNA reductase [Elusimicrobia bacterium]|jgi:glutamyl-tRNA reductase|nr:glutamyl-tRNA reductase [Elusimicrobiota bacterium]
MKIIVLGLNHKTAPIEIREKLAIPESKLIEALKVFFARVAPNETVIISTCNRTEVYVVHSQETSEIIQKIKNFLADYRQVQKSEFENSIYLYEGEECAKHLFQVAAGLDSMVVGEDQVLGQVKTAYLQAHENKTTGRIFNILFQKALNLGKHVRTITGINRGSVSVASVAVELAEKIFGNLSGKKAMIIGAGEMSEITIKNLVEHGIKSIFVTNRTYARAQELARKFGGNDLSRGDDLTSLAVRFDEYPAYLETVDIVISSTAAPYPIMKKEDILPVMRKRKYRALFLIDIAVPRDIEAEVNEIDNVYLYNIDDLQEIVNSNLKEREKEIEKCNRIINEKTIELITQIKKTDYTDLKN